MWLPCSLFKSCIIVRGRPFDFINFAVLYIYKCVSKFFDFKQKKAKESTTVVVWDSRIISTLLIEKFLNQKKKNPNIIKHQN